MKKNTTKPIDWAIEESGQFNFEILDSRNTQSKLVIMNHCTPGPWRSDDGGTIYADIVKQREAEAVKTDKNYEPGDGNIAQCWEDLYSGTIIPLRETKANALLMSKAPEMLAVLEMLVCEVDPSKARRDAVNLLTKLKQQSLEL